MPWTYGKSLLTTTAIVAVFLCASTARGVGGVAFVHTYSNGDVGIEGIGGPRALAMSPDGATLYVSSVSSDDGPTIGVFQRDAATGRLSQVQVVHPDFCTGILPGSISVSPDGGNVYVTGGSCDTLNVYERDSLSGALTFFEVHQQGVGGVDGIDGA